MTHPLRMTPCRALRPGMSPPDPVLHDSEIATNTFAAWGLHSMYEHMTRTMRPDRCTVACTVISECATHNVFCEDRGGRGLGGASLGGGGVTVKGPRDEVLTGEGRGDGEACSNLRPVLLHVCTCMQGDMTAWNMRLQCYSHAPAQTSYEACVPSLACTINSLMS